MNKPTTKSLIAGYLEQLAEKIAADEISGAYAFRGQADAAWKIESAAFRRLKKSGDRPSKKRIIAYLKREILETVRMNGYGIKDGQKLSDLELLAELQHHGAATCLIDFTREFLIAMWFACQIHKGKNNKKTNGKIFIVNTNDLGVFLSLERKDLDHEGGIKAALNFETRERGSMPDIKQTIHRAGLAPLEQISSPKNITSIQQTPLYWHWSPHGMNERILKQNSLFVFGEPGVLDDYLIGEIKILQGHKKKILEELETLGITRDALFKDMPGFAANHGHDQLMSPRPKSAENSLQAGNEAYQKDDLQGAKYFYTQATEIDPDYKSAYGRLALVNTAMDDWEGLDVTSGKLIELAPENANVHLVCGIAKFFKGDFEHAKTYFTNALGFMPNSARSHFYLGKTLFKLKDVEAAKEKLQKARDIASKRKTVCLIKSNMHYRNWTTPMMKYGRG